MYVPRDQGKNVSFYSEGHREPLKGFEQRSNMTSHSKASFWLY